MKKVHDRAAYKVTDYPKCGTREGMSYPLRSIGSTQQSAWVMNSLPNRLRFLKNSARDEVITLNVIAKPKKAIGWLNSFARRCLYGERRLGGRGTAL